MGESTGTAQKVDQVDQPCTAAEAEGSCRAVPTPAMPVERDSLNLFPSEEPFRATAGTPRPVTPPPPTARHLATRRQEAVIIDEVDSPVAVDGLAGSPPHQAVAAKRTDTGTVRAEAAHVRH